MSLLRRRAMMENESYVRLEYIEFVDLAYVDTGYIPTDNTAFEFEALFNVGARCWYGSIVNNSPEPYPPESEYERFHGGADITGYEFNVYIGNIECVAASSDENFHVFYISTELCKIDEIERVPPKNLKLPNLSLYIGNRHQKNVPTVIKYTTNRCRYAKIYEAGELVRHYIPVLSNGRYCMYDLIQGNYYYNAAGVGYLTGG